MPQNVQFYLEPSWSLSNYSKLNNKLLLLTFSLFTTNSASSPLFPPCSSKPRNAFNHSLTKLRHCCRLQGNSSCRYVPKDSLEIGVNDTVKINLALCKKARKLLGLIYVASCRIVTPLKLNKHKTLDIQSKVLVERSKSLNFKDYCEHQKWSKSILYLDKPCF